MEHLSCSAVVSIDDTDVGILPALKEALSVGWHGKPEIVIELTLIFTSIYTLVQADMYMHYDKSGQGVHF